MQFKIRCSAIGQIMTEPRSKSETLSKTCQSYLEEWLKEALYGRRKRVESKYMTKGTVMEDEALDYLSGSFGQLLLKNEKHYEDDWMTGTPDVVTPLVDVKCSWDCFTFPLFDSEIPNKDYYWQLQGYMALTGQSEAWLCYVLMNTPDAIVDKELYYLAQSNGYDLTDFEVNMQLRDYYRYDNVPANLRVKKYHILRSDEHIAAIRERVELCREFITNLNTQLK